MKIAVAGGLGFLGRHIIAALLKEKHDVTIFARREGNLYPGVSFVNADLMVPGDWQKKLAENDIVINLVGVNLFQRWNRKVKELIYDSRIISTANILDSFSAGKSAGKTLINASAVLFSALTEGLSLSLNRTIS